MQRAKFHIRKILHMYYFMSLLLFNSCATLMTGIYQPITIGSSQDSVKIYVNERYMGITPITCHIRKLANDNIYITAKKDGYSTLIFTPKKLLQPIALLNLITNVGLGLIIDYSSGAIIQYPNYISISLIEETSR